MEKISVREMCKNIAESWRRQYPENSGDKFEIYKKLLSLRGKGTKKQIDIIIGNASWTCINCDECGEDSNVAIMIGETHSYESYTAIICKKCLKKAIKL